MYKNQFFKQFFDIEIFFPKTLAKLVEFTLKLQFFLVKNYKIC
jgi:hypothetical protein